VARTAKCLTIFSALLYSTSVFANGVTVLTWHNIVQNPGTDKYAVSTQAFERQLDYLKQNNYHPISLSSFINASRGRGSLPPRAVMLTFDDGLVSYKNTIVPILKKYNYPSVSSIVTGWVDGLDRPPEYRGELMGWDDLKQLDKSPLVEIVSHSHDLHHWIVSGPQGSQSPAGITHQYNLNTRAYETESAFEQRIRDDLLKTRRRFVQMFGHQPQALTWPYGAYDAVTMKIAQSVGFNYQLTLDEGTTEFSGLPDIRRYIVLQEHTMKQFASMLSPAIRLRKGKRFVEFNLDVFAHVSPEYHRKLLIQLARRVNSLGVDTVVVTPFTQDHSQAFFPNRVVPMKYDLLNGVLDRLHESTAISNVCIRIPEIGASLPVTFFAALARRSRFDSLVFDRMPSTTALATIRKTLDRILPNVKIGSWGTQDPKADFSFVEKLPKNLSSTKDQKLLVYLDQKKFFTDSGLADALRSLRQEGVSNYGYTSLNYMAGPTAPDELVDAMAPEIAGAAK